MPDQDVALMAHLFRRAGFGASRDEVEAKAAQGYEAVVEELLNPETQPDIDLDLMIRLNPAFPHTGVPQLENQLWMYRMINSPRQLQEKMTLLWHMIFCAGNAKIDSGEEMGIMVQIFRDHGMGNFRDLLVRLSKNPGMIFFLDNSESHKANVNENYGRELLELFSLGVGKEEDFNYTEDDVKACSRAFTGWNIAPGYPPFPHGRDPWEFRYDPADHDDSEKTFLGETGNWNGEDIIDIICKQPAAGRFMARHLYNYFVADDVPVPSWRQTLPRDPEAIKVLEQAYFDSGYEITAMLRALFTSDFFKSEAVRYAKVKNPAEVVAGTMRMVGEHLDIKPGLFEIGQIPSYMGMILLNPPSVEGWHTGHEWIDSGTLVERVNFATDYWGNTDLPGLQSLINRLMAQGETLSPEQFVAGSIDLVGALNLTDETRCELVAHARQGGALRHGTEAERAEFTERTGEIFQMISSTAEFQFC